MPKPSRPIRTLVRVISLEGAAERRARFERRAADTKLAWSYLPGFTSLHPDLDYDEDEAIVAWGRPLAPGEIGCYSSHYQAWQDLLAGDHDQIVVLEDDVIADWRALEIIAAADFGARGVDYVCLYHMRPLPFSRLGPSPIRFGSLIEVRGEAWGTVGYLLGRKAAALLSAHCRTLCRPIDNEISRTHAHGLPQIAIFPHPIMHEQVESSIGDSRRGRFAVPRRLRTRRFIARVRDHLMRRLQPITRKGLLPRGTTL